MRTRALPVMGNAEDATVYPHENRGTLLGEEDRHGDRWHALTVTLHGRNGGSQAFLSLTPGQARHMAASLTLAAQWVEDREYGRPGPCLCHAWLHTPLSPCPNRAAEDYTMCRECWTPEGGQSELPPYHGSKAV